MPIYEFVATSRDRGCPYCRDGFEVLQPITADPPTVCPKCGAPVSKQFSPPALPSSKSSLDDRAKASGFTKLNRLGKGEYEKQF